MADHHLVLPARRQAARREERLRRLRAVRGQELVEHPGRGGKERRLRAAVVRDRLERLRGHREHRRPPEAGRREPAVERRQERRGGAAAPADHQAHRRRPVGHRKGLGASRHAFQPGGGAGRGDLPQQPEDGGIERRPAPGDRRRQPARPLPVRLQVVEEDRDRGGIGGVEDPRVRDRKRQQARRRDAVLLGGLPERRVGVGAVRRLEQREPGGGLRFRGQQGAERAVRVERPEGVEPGSASPVGGDQPRHRLDEGPPHQGQPAAGVGDSAGSAGSPRSQRHRRFPPGAALLRRRQFAGQRGVRFDPVAAPQPAPGGGVAAQAEAQPAGRHPAAEAQAGGDERPNPLVPSEFAPPLPERGARRRRGHGRASAAARRNPAPIVETSSALSSAGSQVIVTSVTSGRESAVK